jgi:DNA-binding MarR family transcriptional regulator
MAILSQSSEVLSGIIELRGVFCRESQTVTGTEPILGLLLLIVAESPSAVPFKWIRDEFFLPMPEVSQAADNLERLGLTYRTRDLKDRRAYAITATERGLSSADLLQEALLYRIDVLFSSGSPESVMATFKLVIALSDSLRKPSVAPVAEGEQRGALPDRLSVAEFFGAVHRLSHRIVDVAVEMNMTQAELNALLFIAAQSDQTTVSQVSRALGITNTSTIPTVLKLDSKDLVRVRSKSCIDTQTMIRLTSKGLRYATESFSCLDTHVLITGSCFDEANLSQLAALLSLTGKRRMP